MSAQAAVVVGYDGSTHAVRALDWALEEAELRKCPLVLCHVWRERPGDGMARRAAAVHMLDHGARCAAERGHGVTVRTLLLEGSPAARLRGLGTRAGLLVVGSHGLGALARPMQARQEQAKRAQTRQEQARQEQARSVQARQEQARQLLARPVLAGPALAGTALARLTAGLAVGSVSQRVAADSRCPVIVARGSAAPPGDCRPLVVGVSAAPGSRAALGFAAEEARMRGRTLHLVHACRPAETGIGRDLLDATAASPGVEGLVGRSSLVVASVRSALLAAARDGALLVIGTPRERSGPHLPHGSALRSLLHEAPGPLAVVRPLNGF